jgi:hypothetical protein
LIILKPYGNVSCKKELSGRATYVSVGNAALYFAGNIGQAVSEYIQNNQLRISKTKPLIFISIQPRVSVCKDHHQPNITIFLK